MKVFKKLIVSLFLGIALASPAGAAFAKSYHSDYYLNSNGVSVHTPIYTNTAPIGSSAQCRDGSYSFSQHRRGTCSYHGGVRQWLK